MSKFESTCDFVSGVEEKWACYYIKFFILTGVVFLRECQAGTYDAIIIDSSDPVGMITGLKIYF